jgi:glycerol uptake facilitator-like aquaporin
MQHFVAEFLGTFFFLSVILNVTSKSATWPAMTPLLIAVGLLAAMATASHASGAHLNPAVTIMMAVKGGFPQGNVLPYIAAQVFGGIAALYVYRMVNKSGAKA